MGNTENYQKPPEKQGKNGLKTFLIGLVCLAIVVVALVVFNTWFIWPTALGGIAVVAGIVMMATGK